MPNEQNDRIEKKVTLRAPVSKVWRAIADAREFGQWFGIQLEGEFVAGKQILGTWSEKVDEEMIRKEEERLGLTPGDVTLPKGPAVFGTVERIEPEAYFSFRWIPYGIDDDADPDQEPTTLVEFKLEQDGTSTVLTIVESGFDRIPLARRAEAFRMNDGGWTGQIKNIEKYVSQA